MSFEQPKVEQREIERLSPLMKAAQERCINSLKSAERIVAEIKRHSSDVEHLQKWEAHRDTVALLSAFLDAGSYALIDEISDDDHVRATAMQRVEHRGEVRLDGGGIVDGRPINQERAEDMVRVALIEHALLNSAQEIYERSCYVIGQSPDYQHFVGESESTPANSDGLLWNTRKTAGNGHTSLNRLYEIDEQLLTVNAKKGMVINWGSTSNNYYDVHTGMCDSPDRKAKIHRDLASYGEVVVFEKPLSPADQLEFKLLAKAVEKIRPSFFPDLDRSLLKRDGQFAHDAASDLPYLPGETEEECDQNLGFAKASYGRILKKLEKRFAQLSGDELPMTPSEQIAKMKAEFEAKLRAKDDEIATLRTSKRRADRDLIELQRRYDNAEEIANAGRNFILYIEDEFEKVKRAVPGTFLGGQSDAQRHAIGVSLKIQDCKTVLFPEKQ